MNPQRNGDPRFRITYVPQAKEQLRQIVRRAGQLGRMAELLAAARLVEYHLNRPASVRRIDRGIPERSARLTPRRRRPNSRPLRCSPRAVGCGHPRVRRLL